MASKFIIQLMKKGAQALSGQGKTTGTEVIKSIKPDVGKLDKIQKGKKRITDITDKYAVGFAKDNPELLKKFRKSSKKNLDSISKIYKGKKDGGRMGLKFGSRPKTNIEKINQTFNAKKSDLDKDGKLSGYEKKRGKAIAQAMKNKKKII